MVYRSLPRSIPLKRAFGPRREPMEEQWAALQTQLQEKMAESRRGTEEKKPGEVSKELNKELIAFTELAENELAAGHDIFLERDKHVGRANISTSIKPVLGWRSKEKYQASSEMGAKWRWVYSHLAEVVRMEWAMRRSKKRIREGGTLGREAEGKLERQQLHTGHLVEKVAAKGTEMVESMDDQHMWRVRWILIADMRSAIYQGIDLEVASICTWAAEARKRAEEDEAANREGFARKAVKKGGKAAHIQLKGPTN